VLIETGLGGFQGSGGLLDVSGGSGGGSAGNGGDGGQVLIQTLSGGIGGLLTVDFAGGNGASPGAAGSLIITSVPEPASLALLAAGMIGVLSSARFASRRSRQAR
jgi:hypothetical protein